MATAPPAAAPPRPDGTGRAAPSPARTPPQPPRATPPRNWPRRPVAGSAPWPFPPRSAAATARVPAPRPPAQPCADTSAPPPSARQTAATRSGTRKTSPSPHTRHWPGWPAPRRTAPAAHTPTFPQGTHCPPPAPRSRNPSACSDPDRRPARSPACNPGAPHPACARPPAPKATPAAPPAPPHRWSSPDSTESPAARPRPQAPSRSPRRPGLRRTHTAVPRSDRKPRPAPRPHRGTSPRTPHPPADPPSGTSPPPASPMPHRGPRPPCRIPRIPASSAPSGPEQSTQPCSPPLPRRSPAGEAGLIGSNRFRISRTVRRHPSAADGDRLRSGPRAGAEKLQGDLLRRTAVALALDGNGHEDGMLPGHDRLAERLGGLHLRLEHPLIGDGSGRAVGADLSGHVDPAPVFRLRGNLHAAHLERRVVKPQIQHDTGRYQQDHGKRRTKHPAHPRLALGRFRQAAGTPDLLRRHSGLTHGRGGNPWPVPNDV